MKRSALVFPGQGSQVVGMAREFCDSWAPAREIMARAEKISGLALSRLCFEGPLEKLTRTVNLQPAVVAVDLICCQALAQAGVKPHAVAGHSLGEYPALAAAGVIDFDQCLELVTLRGRLMDREATSNPGAMAAVMGLAPQEVADLCQEAGGQVQPANFNTPAQTVITGASPDVARAGELAAGRGAKVIPLAVSGAWHSPLMEKARQEMAQALEQTRFQAPACPHVPNTTGIPTRDAALIKSELQKQITAPVRWVQTIEALLQEGVEAFVEVGPKNVLAGLIKKTAPKGTQVLGVADPAGLQKALDALA